MNARLCVICGRETRWKRSWTHFFLQPPPLCAPRDTEECRRILDRRLAELEL